MELTPELILAAYREGAFPMGEEGTQIVGWYQPAVRAILPLNEFHCSRRLARKVRSGKFEVVTDLDFATVIDSCADRDSTWITGPIREAYIRLHKMGHAHSVEAWIDDDLVGGLYGVRVGGAFMAESMFHTVTDAGKVALVGLVNHLRDRGFQLLDIQMVTPITKTFGAVEVRHGQYLARLERALKVNPGWGPISRDVACQVPGNGSQ